MAPNSRRSSRVRSRGTSQNASDGNVGRDANEDPQKFIDETENLCDALRCPSWRSVELVPFILRVSCIDFSDFSKAVDKARGIEDRELETRVARDQQKRPREDYDTESHYDHSQRGGHQSHVSYSDDRTVS
ncbi:hypothetical protein QQ045_007655 [Rhodiola kirilowii]